MSEENTEVAEKLSIGARLRQRRRDMGDISEQTVNEATHIRADFIRFMEEDHFDLIPLAPVYRIGFLRIYAKFLHLDADELVNEYKKLAKLTGGNTRKPVAGVPFDVEISDGSEYADSERKNAGFSKKSLSSVLKILAGVVVAIVVAVIIVMGFSKISNLAENTNEIVADDVAAEYEFVVVSSASQRLRINEDYQGWDRDNNQPIAGKLIFEEQVIPGSKRTLKAHGKLYVQQEVPGSVTIEIDGKNHSSSKGNAFTVDPAKAD
ncbi:MAG: helix-turn-helix domain-containing protein [Opitutales bacterium]|nr:helix-turn-helix domain-containing protein [Opitutales bacterium]